MQPVSFECPSAGEWNWKVCTGSTKSLPRRIMEFFRVFHLSVGLSRSEKRSQKLKSKSLGLVYLSRPKKTNSKPHLKDPVGAFLLCDGLSRPKKTNRRPQDPKNFVGVFLLWIGLLPLESFTQLKRRNQDRKHQMTPHQLVNSSSLFKPLVISCCFFSYIIHPNVSFQYRTPLVKHSYGGSCARNLLVNYSNKQTGTIYMADFSIWY